MGRSSRRLMRTLSTLSWSYGAACFGALAALGCGRVDQARVSPSTDTRPPTATTLSPAAAERGAPAQAGRAASAAMTSASASAGMSSVAAAGAAGIAAASGRAAAAGAAAGAAMQAGAGAVRPASAAYPEPCDPVASAEHLAFPGAEGFGRYARGGRGGAVCHVTTLADEGAGSLRDCVSAGDRTVVFDVSGWITLSKALGITVDRLTIAGQTAPGGGIGIRGQKLSIGGSDIVLRFVRVRRGTIKTGDRNDAMAISSKSSRVIVDHCSVGFGTDENLSMPGDEGVGPKHLTVQWTVIAWGLQRNNHSAGSLLTANGTTIHHSLYAFNGTRNPKARSQDGQVLDFVNNVVYGWNAPDPVGESMGWSISKQAFLLADTANGEHNANAVGNYFIAHGSVEAGSAFSSGAKNDAGMPTFHLYFEDNLLDGNANGKLDVSKSDWSMVGTATQLPQRLAAPQVCTDKAVDAFERVVQYVGASAPARDQVDDALVSAIRSQSGTKIQDEHDLKVGADGYGELAEGQAPPDSDRDGVPDAWEAAHGLAAQQADDAAADPDGDGYTNLEDYLNELARPAFP